MRLHNNNAQTIHNRTDPQPRQLQAPTFRTCSLTASLPIFLSLTHLGPTGESQVYSLNHPRQDDPLSYPSPTSTLAKVDPRRTQGLSCLSLKGFLCLPSSLNQKHRMVPDSVTLAGSSSFQGIFVHFHSRSRRWKSRRGKNAAKRSSDTNLALDFDRRRPPFWRRGLGCRLRRVRVAPVNPGRAERNAKKHSPREATLEITTRAAVKRRQRTSSLRQPPAHKLLSPPRRRLEQRPQSREKQPPARGFLGLEVP